MFDTIIGKLVKDDHLTSEAFSELHLGSFYTALIKAVGSYGRKYSTKLDECLKGQQVVLINKSQATK